MFESITNGLKEVKMRIGILTFHNADNCGAVLQAYALSGYLNTLPECQAEIINYYCSKLENHYLPSHVIKSSSLVKTIIKGTFFRIKIKQIHKNFKLFRNEHLCISQKRYTAANISEAADDYDIIISGSDQVFNLKLTGNDTTYFCDFINEKKRKFTYAASVGSLPDEKNDIDKFISLINGFEQISFREKSSVDFANNKCPEIKCRTNIDPVFLLNAGEWSTMAIDNSDKNYIMYFQVQRPFELKKVINAVKDIAAKKNATPALAMVYPCKPRLGFKYFECKTPAEFLGRIKNAECVVTTSFHATAFAIIMHKNFFAEVNIENSYRIIDLLELTGLSHRAMRDGAISCNYEITEEEWQYADEQIKKEREKSINYLNSILNQG